MYDAFISYRHSELDRFVAENLHKKLEAFRLPKSLVKQRGADCKKKIERVFRDRDELPLATNLADPITQALEDSEFLIVICSPRLPQSLWCKKEIETFISMHGREHVLAVLIEGEPEESFPPELLYREREITAEDGTTQIVREPVEPLAADVRGTTKKEILKKMDEELLRLAAAMFECGYDDLKQRHKEQKMKKLLTVSLSASAVFLLFGAVSTTMAIRIQSQKEQIQEQSAEISAQKDKIEEQYQAALYNQSLTMAEKSTNLLKNGDRLEAIRTAYEALGTTEDGTPMPVTAEAQYALAESSYLYQDGENYEPMYMLKHNANISHMQVSPNAERLLTIDQYGNICVWDIEKRKQLAQIANTSLGFASDEKYFFLNDNQILYESNSGFQIYDLEKQEIVYAYDGQENFLKGKTDKDNRWFAVVLNDFHQDTLVIYDTKDFRELYSFVVPEGEKVSDAMTFEAGGRRFAFALEPDSTGDTKGSRILTMNMETGEVQGEFSAEYSLVKKLLILDGVLYAGVNQSTDDAFPDGDYNFNAAYQSVLYAIHADTMTTKWEYRYAYEWISDFQINEADFSRHILLSYYSNAHILNMDTGVGEHELGFGDQIITTLYFTNSDRFVLITRDGEYHTITGYNGDDIVIVGFFRANSDNYRQVLLCKNGFVSLPYSDSNVTYYERAEGKAFEELCALDKEVDKVCVNAKETRAVVTSQYDFEEGTAIFLLNLETGEVLQKIVKDDVNVYAGVVGDGEDSFFVITRYSVSLFSMEDGSFQTEYSFPEMITIDYLSKGPDGNSLVIRTNQAFWKISLKDGKQECIKIPYKDDFSNIMCINDSFEIYALVDRTENAIFFYRTGEEEAYARAEVVASFVKDICFAPDSRHIFIYYVNGTAGMYDLENCQCVQEYNALGNFFHGFEAVGDGEEYLLYFSGGGYLLNSDFEVIANIPECEAILPKARKFIGADDATLYTCPVYSLEQLLLEAEKILAEP